MNEHDDAQPPADEGDREMPGVYPVGFYVDECCEYTRRGLDRRCPMRGVPWRLFAGAAFLIAVMVVLVLLLAH